MRWVHCSGLRVAPASANAARLKNLATLPRASHVHVLSSSLRSIVSAICHHEHVYKEPIIRVVPESSSASSPVMRLRSVASQRPQSPLLAFLDCTAFTAGQVCRTALRSATHRLRQWNKYLSEFLTLPEMLVWSSA